LKATSAPEIGLLLAGALCLLPFLLPYHQQPVLSFFPEWLAAALGTAAAFVMLAGRGFRAAAAPPTPALWLAAFALFLAARAAGGGQTYPQVSLLAAIYALYAILLIQLGAQLATVHGLERTATVLAAFLLAGALANSLAGIIQFYGRPVLFEDLIAERPGHGAYGNIAQWNLYANYLALGTGALLFLWLRMRVRTTYALLALALLTLGSALSSSRGALLYALWYAALGWTAARLKSSTETQRLRFAAYFVAGVTLAAHFAVPWLNSTLHLGAPGQGTLDRVLFYMGEHGRRDVALLALRTFNAAPIAGVGIGEFPGAAFELGLDPSLTRGGEVWTSPHNLPLHLLAETGAVGTMLVLGGLGVWGYRAAQRYRTDPRAAIWWILAATGIGLIHSLTEFPFWSAHFLAVTALLIGASSAFATLSPVPSRVSAIAGGAVCIVLSAVLVLMLRDYVRLDSARFAGTTLTLAPTHQAQLDSATMRDLSRGLLAPVAERWIVLGASLDKNDLASKLAVSERVARTWPANAVVVRHAVFLAFDARAKRAEALLARALRTFPHRRDDTISILERARAADPGAIEPLLAIARAVPFPAIEPQR
jgi:O-antigen ligase